MKQYIKTENENEASDMFIDSHANGHGGKYTHCQCGIDHYALQDMDKDDRIPEESDIIKHHDDTYVMAFELNNRCFVEECDSCKKELARYENFIWENRTHIRQYLKLRIDQEKSWADQEHLANVLSGISKP